MRVGIEKINFYAGPAYIDVKRIFQLRGLELNRFDNLMMEKKSVGLPCEDPVTNGVNAAKPIVDQLTETARNNIEMLITSSESGIDFGKSISTYVHDYLALGRHCRLFEVKQACYGGTAALQTAINHVAASLNPEARVLIIATDTARAASKNTYAEPSQATGAVAMIVSRYPDVMETDFGAFGLYSYEVMDTCRPLPDLETGDADLSLLSYLDCFENCYNQYSAKIEGVDFVNTFDYLAFHTPFAGMVKGAHRNLYRKIVRGKLPEIEADFQRRIGPSLNYCVQIGNIYSATLYFALCSLIDHGDLSEERRIGLFSYGSGCSSEFYSAVVSENSRSALSTMGLQEQLNRRFELDEETYERILDLNLEWIFGVKDREVDLSGFSDVYDHFFAGRNLLRLKGIKEYHREYVWS